MYTEKRPPTTAIPSGSSFHCFILGAVAEMKLVSAICVKVKDKVVTLKHKSMAMYEK
jgi:hypothetical protein